MDHKNKENWEKWYSLPENRQKHYQRVKRNTRDKKEWFRTLKVGVKCLYCPEEDPVCIDWHHRDPKQKDLEVSTMMAKGFGKARVLAEIEKCDPVCSNCHRKLHAGRSLVARELVL